MINRILEYRKTIIIKHIQVHLFSYLLTQTADQPIAWPQLSAFMFMFMHLADAFIQSDLAI